MANLDTRPDFITIPGPDDFHLHLRQGDDLASFARTVAKSVRRGLIMPNTSPPIVTVSDLVEYRSRIVAAAPGFMPLMSFKIVESVDAGEVERLADAGAVAGKYYPAGVTTNSEDGLDDPKKADAILSVMQERDLVLCIHAENPGGSILEREAGFHPTIEWIVKRFPKLRVVVEHVSDARTVRLVCEMPSNVAATVTVHHLLLTLDDLLGNGIRPHLYCKPILKQEHDRNAIQEAVLSGHPRFFFGSDSAPHGVGAKECACGAAGVYSAPVAIPLLIEFFESRDLERLVPFIAHFGADFYGLPRIEELKRYVRVSQRVPDLVDGVVPLCAGEDLEWKPESG